MHTGEIYLSNGFADIAEVSEIIKELRDAHGILLNASVADTLYIQVPTNIHEEVLVPLFKRWDRRARAKARMLRTNRRKRYHKGAR